jgi:hypothetical protein
VIRRSLGFLNPRPKLPAIRVRPRQILVVKLFYSGPVVNAEMLMVMLEKHGIRATQEFVDATTPDDGDLSRPAKVLVAEVDYDRAHQLFYAEREDEL